MRENRQYGFVPTTNKNIGRCIGGSKDGKLMEGTRSLSDGYQFHPLRNVHGVSYGFWYPVGDNKTPVDIILQLAGAYRPKRTKS